MDTGAFAYETWNLGDDIQALAALAHLGQVTTLVDRDKVAEFRGPETGCIFNAWFGYGRDFRVPSPSLRPIWYGFTGRHELFESPWMEYLAGCGPVGCRDVMTTGMLVDRGVDAYWSSCLTLFLSTALRLPSRPRHGVLFVDLAPEAERFIPADIVSRATRLSTFVPPTMRTRILDRWAAASRLIERLASAELVVTRRLHAALPAASFGTPVVAVPEAEISFAERRFSGVESIIPTIFLDRTAQDLRGIDWRHVPPATIPPAIQQAYHALERTLAARGLRAGQPAESPLDDPRRIRQRLVNAERILRPGRVALRAGDRLFELDVEHWSDRYIDVRLSGFRGLSKLSFELLLGAADAETWIPCGRLVDLVIDGDEADRRTAIAI
jgi:hypothetical protein